MKYLDLTYLPYDVEQMIFKMIHEMGMVEICKELKKNMEEMNKTLDYFQKRAFYPYLLWGRVTKLDNKCCQMKIDRYIHYKKFNKCAIQLIRPKEHIIYL